MKAKLSQPNIKQIISGSLVIWLSGIVFLFCCEIPNAQASMTESCPLAKKNKCSKQSNAETISGFASIQKSQPAIDCCKGDSCPMKSAGENASANCCSCCGDSCPMKNKDAQATSVDTKNVTVATGESCCNGGSCCKSKQS